MSAKPKSQFYWASIAGADSEPVEVTKVDGRRVAYTCGCADPFYLDDPDNPVQLLLEEGDDKPEPMDRLPTPAMKKRAAASYERKLRRDRAAGIHHGWRGPR